MHNNKTQETRDTKNFPQGNHKGENPTTSSEIESTPKLKTRKQEDDLPIVAISLLSQQLLSLTHVPQWVSVCVINREAHSLFILFCSLNFHSNMSASLKNYLLESTYLGDSNNPSAPQLVGTFPLRPTRRVILNKMVGTIAPLYNKSYMVDFSRII